MRMYCSGIIIGIRMTRPLKDDTAILDLLVLTQGEVLTCTAYVS